MHPFGVILPDWVAHYANLVIKLDSYFCGVKLDHVAIVSLLSASGTPLDRIPNQRGFGLLIPLASPRSFCVDSCLTRTTPLDTPSAPDFHVSLSFIYHTFPDPLRSSIFSIQPLPVIPPIRLSQHVRLGVLRLFPCDFRFGGAFIGAPLNLVNQFLYCHIAVCL